MLYHPLTSADGTPDEADWHLAEADLARPQAGMPAWRVSRRKLRGGRRDGVEVVTLNNGNLAVDIVPTRGMGIHRGTCGQDRLGWDSPVRDGPVNPRFIRLEDRGGLGWLDGFDELMVRCGLAHNGPPFETFDPPDGGATARRTMHPLHGRIANTPASVVGVEIDDGADRTITVIGEVAESSLFHPQLHLRTEISTRPGSNRLTVRDTITNRSDQPGAFQLLYHWNFGPPYLGDGSTFHAPIAETVSPRPPRRRRGRPRRHLWPPKTRFRRASLPRPPRRHRSHRIHPGHARRSDRVEGGRPPLLPPRTPLLHLVEEHRRPERRLRHRPRTGD